MGDRIELSPGAHFQETVRYGTKGGGRRKNAHIREHGVILECRAQMAGP